MSCDFCHKLTKFPYIIRREDVGILHQLCLNWFEKTPPSGLVPDNDKNTNEQEGHRKNTCDSCGKSFTRLSGLKKHIMTVHEGQRNHKCDYCGKSFTESGNLKTHIKTLHEGEKKLQM